MYDNIIETYKYIIIEKETTKIKLELFLQKKEYLSTILDKAKEDYCDLVIKATKKHLDECDVLYKKLYKFISNKLITRMSYVETVVFKEIIMKNKDVDVVSKKYNIAVQTIHNTKCTLMKRIDKIQIKREF